MSDPWTRESFSCACILAGVTGWAWLGTDAGWFQASTATTGIIWILAFLMAVVWTEGDETDED